MKRLPRIVAMVTAAFAASIVLVFAGPSGAYAAAYDGTDPNSTGCSASASTVASVALGPSASVELRYSSSCRTTWARLSGGYKGEPGDCAASYAKIHRNSDGREYRRTWVGGDSGSIYTKQLSDAGVTSYAFGSVDYCYAGPYAKRTASY